MKSNERTLVSEFAILAQKWLKFLRGFLGLFPSYIKPIYLWDITAMYLSDITATYLLDITATFCGQSLRNTGCRLSMTRDAERADFSRHWESEGGILLYLPFLAYLVYNYLKRGLLVQITGILGVGERARGLRT